MRMHNNYFKCTAAADDDREEDERHLTAARRVFGDVICKQTTRPVAENVAGLFSVFLFIYFFLLLMQFGGFAATLTARCTL